MPASNSPKLIEIKQYFCRRSAVAVIDNTQLLSIGGNLKGDLVVFRIFSPTSRLRGPDDAIALYLTSIGPNEIIEPPDITQKQDAAIGMGHSETLRVAIRNRSEGSSADHLGLKRCRRRYRRQPEISDEHQERRSWKRKRNDAADHFLFAFSSKSSPLIHRRLHLARQKLPNGLSWLT
jgi:hypothetical protein